LKTQLSLEQFGQIQQIQMPLPSMILVLLLYTGGTNLLGGFTIGGGSSLIDLDDKAALQLGRGSLENCE